MYPYNQDNFPEVHRDTGKVTIEPYGSNGTNSQQVYTRQPRHRELIADGPVGIGGMLKLVAFGLILGLIFLPLRAVMEGDAWSWIEAAAVVWQAYLFFTRHRWFPGVTIASLALNMLIGIALVNSPEFAGIPRGFAMFFVIVPAALWIPYFLLSKRVKNTFVN